MLNFFCITVPTPIVNVTAPSTQIVGESLTLQCTVITMRGITSGVNIVWNNGTVLQRMNNVPSNMTNDSLVYTNSYTISQLSTGDQGSVYWCTAEINSSPMEANNGSITLDVTGKQTTCIALAYAMCMRSCD